MITITQEIRHHGRNFSINTEEWPEADGAAKAIRWLRGWIEEQPQAATRLLHCAIEARQTWAGDQLRLIKLDELEAATQQARAAGLLAFYDEAPQGRIVKISAGREEE